VSRFDIPGQCTHCRTRTYLDAPCGLCQPCKQALFDAVSGEANPEQFRVGFEAATVHQAMRMRLLNWVPLSSCGPFEFHVEGDPVGEPRPHPSRAGGKISMHRDARATPWKKAVRKAALAQLGIPTPPRVPIFAERAPVLALMTFELPRPVGQWRSRTELRADAPKHPTGKPDPDNLGKAVLDALGGWPKGADPIAWFDDAQVVALLTRKVYCSHESKPGALVALYLLD